VSVLANVARRGAPALLALVVASGLVAVPVAPIVTDVAAATGGLTIVGRARYSVQPEHGRVRITVGLDVANHLHDTTTRRFYFDHGFLAVLPGTTGFRLTADSGQPSVRVSKATADYTLLQLNFGRRLYSGKSASLQLRFDLADRGGDATRDVRIGTALVSFPVWAFASPSTSGATVGVVFPKGYSVTVESGDLPAPTTDSSGRTIYQTGPIANPSTFFVFLVADRPGSYKTSAVSTQIGEAKALITVRAWPDDPAWAKRIRTLFKKGLPVLGRLIGLPWTHSGSFEVQEAVSRTTGGYAGLFDPKSGRIEVAYYADSGVVLHEASHVWFNGALLADRWANEAFASYYALGAAKRLKEEVTLDKLTPTLEKSRIPLNAWGEIGRASAATEDYAYAASFALAQAIAQRAGGTSLQKVWQAAAERTGAYQPAHPGDTVQPETVDGPPDWRGLLDLLEDETGKSFDDLWRTWVVRPTELSLLDARATARAEYKAVVAEAGPWELPAVIRQAMRAWQFDTATSMLVEARKVLQRRQQLAEAAAGAGLTLPPQLEQAFEATGDFAAANAEADAEAAAIQTLVIAAGSRPTDSSLLVQLGLIGAAPEATLEAARNAFAAGDLRLVVQDASAAQGTWLGAEEIGRNRVLAGIGIAVIALMGLALLIARLIGARRARARRRAMAHRISAQE
jgi:hypothetical protein